MKTAHFKSEEEIISAGDDGDSAYLIVSGAVEVVVGEGDKARTVATLKAGEIFGEMSLLAPGPRSATVRAVEDTECTVTSYDDFMESIRENPEQAIEFMKTLVVRLRTMNELLAGLDPDRGLAGVLWDYISAADLEDATLSDEERERRRAVYTMPMLW